MNKKLLALAVGAAISFPTVALAEGPKVYGKVNVSVEQEDDGTDDQMVLNSNASRLGVKGSFDLNVGDLEAIYKAEYEINVDDGSKGLKGSGEITTGGEAGEEVEVETGSPFTQRNIYAGLKGGFGTIKAGNFDTPTKKAQGKIDQFNDLGGDIKNILAGEVREQNIIQYSTPKLADSITLNVAFVPGEGRNDAEGTDVEEGLADTTSISAVFKQGGIYAAISNDSNLEDKLEADTATDSFIDVTRVVAGFKADAFEVGALYQIAEEVESDGEDTSIVVSAAFKMDRIKLKAQYGVTEGDTNDEEITGIGLGADYKLAKSSKAYVYFAEKEEDVADTEESTFGIGLEHKF